MLNISLTSRCPDTHNFQLCPLAFLCLTFNRQ